MSISDRIYDNRLSFGTRVNPLVVLIAVSMIVFVVLAFFKALTYVFLPEGGAVTETFNKNVAGWFALSDNAGFAFSRPWTLLSYSFVHLQIWNLLANMLWLWSFGYIFIDLTGNRKLVPVFLYGSLAGAAAFLLVASQIPAFKSLPGGSFLFGAAPATLAIAVAVTTISPGYKILPIINGGIPLWILTVVYIVIDFAGIPFAQMPVIIAHLAGGLTGLLFILLLRRGYDGSDWMNALYDWFMNLFNPDKPPKKTASVKSSFFYNGSVAPYKKTPHLTQQKLDELLDKMNQTGGYEQLSNEEKALLERASKEDFNL